MADGALALHETMEIHELLTFKNVCMTKSTTMRRLVSDDGLNNLLRTCAAADRQHIQDLEGLISRGSTTTAE